MSSSRRVWMPKDPKLSKMGQGVSEGHLISLDFNFNCDLLIFFFFWGYFHCIFHHFSLHFFPLFTVLLPLFVVWIQPAWLPCLDILYSKRIKRGFAKIFFLSLPPIQICHSILYTDKWREKNLKVLRKKIYKNSKRNLSRDRKKLKEKNLFSFILSPWALQLSLLYFPFQVWYFLLTLTFPHCLIHFLLFN